ncbi:hypothetical protein ARMSODRAFT_1040091 [Armillaria solidipes]|uniref:Uncharacterized protein n=1 Tax=Armillaria solidipes TaxID=1076256 RepID=A0A2H3BCA3_9AGAR|nr:hypothetical protein ARMSODRAFT_1040091 [Armillaria solidipes]
MPTDSLLATKRIRCCFFSSLVFVTMVPVACIIFGKTLHPREFEYHAPAASVDDGTRMRKISLSADLISADLKKGQAVLDWAIVDDTCSGPSLANCTTINIYFAANLLQQSDMNRSKPSSSNKPTDPTFIWNITAYESDDYSDFLVFQTVSAIFYPTTANTDSKHPIRHSHASDVYYPFNRYTAEVFCFAEDASTNAPVKLHLQDTSGLVGDLKIQPTILSDTDSRFGFRQRNEIVVVPISTVFAFTQLRSTMPGAPDGFGDILDPAKDSREQLTWSALVKALSWRRNATVKSTNADSVRESYDMRPLISASDKIELQRFDGNQCSTDAGDIVGSREKIVEGSSRHNAG